MTSLRVRPKIRFETHLSSQEIVDAVNKNLETTHFEVFGKAYPTHIHLEVKSEIKHFWSPQLDLSFNSSNQEMVVLNGRYGPQQNIWFLFTLGYIVFGLSLFFSLIAWGTYYSLGKESVWAYVSIVCAALLAALYLIGQAGQKLGSAQTFILHHFLEEALHEKGKFV